MISCNDETVRAILDTAERFTERELADEAAERDRYPAAEFSRETFQRAAEAGLVLLSAPERLGGCALPAAAWSLVLSRLGAGDAGFAASLLAYALAAEAILKWGGEGLLSRWLSPTPSPLLGYPLYLEAGDMEGVPELREEQDGLIINGQARLVANAPVADAAVIAAQTADQPVLVLVPLGVETRPPPREMLGLRSCPVGHLDFADLRLPPENLIARGSDKIAELHDLFLPAAAAILLSTLKASLDYAMEYGRERYQGGQMISGHSQLRKMYGRMAAEHLALREAWLRVVENDSTPLARLAVKILVAEAAIRATTDGVQLLGGYGYTRDYPQERRMRDARQAAEILGSPTPLRLALIEELIGG